MKNVWDLINDCSYQKKDLIKNSDNPELAEKLYEPFIVNKAFSYHPDTIFYANEVNQIPNCDKYLQYAYYLARVPSRKRFAKWHKKPKDEYFDYCQTYFKTGRRETEEILRVLPVDELEKIKALFVGTK